MEESVSWTIVISACTGGLAGAIVTAIATHLRNKRELALKIVDRYVDEMFHKYATAKDYMHDSESMAAPEAWDHVANVGNWFEVIAACYLKGYADREVLELMGFPERCKNFLASMETAKVAIDDGEQNAFNATTLSHFRHLQKLKMGEVPTTG